MLRANKLHNWNDNFGYRHFPDDNLWWCSEGKIALFQNKRTSNDIFPITHDYMYPHAGSQCMNSRLIKSIKWIIRGVSRVSWFAYYIVISKKKTGFCKAASWNTKAEMETKTAAETQTENASRIVWRLLWAVGGVSGSIYWFDWSVRWCD